MGVNNPSAAWWDPAGQGYGLRVAVGRYLLEVGLEGGIRIERGVSAGEAAPVRPRLTATLDLPAGPNQLLDRERELGQVLTGLRSKARRFEIYGPPGVGKTALLRVVASHPLAASFRDGITYIQSGSKPLEDLLASMYDAFFEPPNATRLVPLELRAALRDRQALVLLDDLELSPAEAAELFQVAPACTFLLASTQRHFPLEGQSLALDGLPVEVALALFERGLGRSLETDELSAAGELCTALWNHPLSVLQAGALASRSGGAVATVTAIITDAAGPSQALTARLLDILSAAERQLVYVLAALGGSFGSLDYLASLARIPDPGPVLEKLARDGLVEGYSGRYRLAGNLGQVVLNNWDLSEWKVGSLQNLADWAGKQPADSPALLAETGLALHLMSWAAGTGRWAEALRLSRPLQDSLVLAGRWGGWSHAIALSLQASQQLGARAVEARALHQAGVLSLCLGDEGRARASLIRALTIRQSLGDKGGTALTQNNLDVLLGKPASRSSFTAGSVIAAGMASKAATPPPPVGVTAQPTGGSPGSVASHRLSGPTRRPVQLLALAGILLLLLLAIPAGMLVWHQRSGRSTSTGQPTVLLPGQSADNPLSPTGQLLFPLIFKNFMVEGAAQMSAVAALPPTQLPALQFPPFTISPPTPGPTPTSSSTPTITPTLAGATLIADTCEHPISWMVYTVQANDTLPLLAASVGITPQVLMQANCLKDLNWLTAGEQVWVPRLPGAAIPGTQEAPATISTSPLEPAPSEVPPAPLSTPASAAPPAACLEFEDIETYSTYAAGEGFKTGDFPLVVNGFVDRNGRYIRSGWVEVGAGGYAGDAGQELELDRASIGLSLSQPVAGLTFLFNDYSGSLNLELNGAFLRFANFADLQGLTLGGAVFNVKGGKGDGQGSVEVLGVLRTIQIGGEQLWVDRVCFK